MKIENGEPTDAETSKRLEQRRDLLERVADGAGADLHEDGGQALARALLAYLDGEPADPSDAAAVDAYGERDDDGEPTKRYLNCWAAPPRYAARSVENER